MSKSGQNEPEKGKTKKEVIRKLKDHAKVPRQSKGGEPIPANFLNKNSRGPNYLEIITKGTHNGNAPSIGMRNPYGENYYVIHPDGHQDLPDQKWHNDFHGHAKNSKGEELIVMLEKKSGDTEQSQNDDSKSKKSQNDDSNNTKQQNDDSKSKKSQNDDSKSKKSNNAKPQNDTSKKAKIQNNNPSNTSPKNMKTLAKGKLNKLGKINKIADAVSTGKKIYNASPSNRGIVAAKEVSRWAGKIG